MPVMRLSKPKLTFGLKEEKPISGEIEARKRLAMGAKVLPQTGQIKDLKRDMSRRARLPGKRISKTGKTYWETRKNRSDALGKNI